MGHIALQQQRQRLLRPEVGHGGGGGYHRVLTRGVFRMDGLDNIDIQTKVQAVLGPRVNADREQHPRHTRPQQHPKPQNEHPAQTLNNARRWRVSVCGGCSFGVLGVVLVVCVCAGGVVICRCVCVWI